MLKVQSSVLKYPGIKYRNNIEHRINESDAQWNLDDKQFLSTTNNDLSYMILYESNVETDHIDDIVENFEKQLSLRRVGSPRLEGKFSIRTDSTGLRNRLQQAQMKDVDLLILMSQDTYSNFKYLADKVFGIPTIVMVTDSNFKSGNGNRQWNRGGLDQYIGNIMMKANPKTGGINHMAISKHGDIEKWLSKTLVLGADVTHPSNGAPSGCTSVAAVVSSVENTGGRFLGSLALQSEGGKEVSPITTTQLSAPSDRHR